MKKPEWFLRMVTPREAADNYGAAWWLTMIGDDVIAELKMQGIKTVYDFKHEIENSDTAGVIKVIGEDGSVRMLGMMWGDLDVGEDGKTWISVGAVVRNKRLKSGEKETIVRIGEDAFKEFVRRSGADAGFVLVGGDSKRLYRFAEDVLKMNSVAKTSEGRLYRKDVEPQEGEE